MAAFAPAVAMSCLPLTLLPAARGRLLVPMATPPVPALVRLVTDPVPVAPDTLLWPPETGL